MTETPSPPDAGEFQRWVRDALTNLYDPAALATHPLAVAVSELATTALQNKAEILRARLLEVIEQLRPATDGEPQPSSQEWRPFLVLHGRYVEGSGLQALQDLLSLSER